jgi:hypothetical protein
MNDQKLVEVGEIITLGSQCEGCPNPYGCIRLCAIKTYVREAFKEIVAETRGDE